ncbi:MAG TPA: F0F1 ATP synthase subunit epsilon [Dehalococcoidia bacterium]|nr:F0F1 ATP synthase subunit epsilon [Dehalococcoidia bacterium]
MPLSLDIVTAEREVLSADGFDIIVAPGIEGELGILPRHAPLMTILETGELRARRGNEEIDLFVAGGFLEVRDDRVTILADSAERSEEIDIARAEAARRRAEEAMANRQADIDVAAVFAAARRAEVRIRVAERRRRRGGPGQPGQPRGE